MFRPGGAVKVHVAGAQLVCQQSQAAAGLVLDVFQP